MTSEALKIDPHATLWVTDAELIRRSGIPEKRARASYYTRDQLLPVIGLSGGNFDLLLETRFLPQGHERWKRVVWDIHEIKHLLGQLNTVYFVGLRDLIKIGFTGDLSRRLKGFETSLPYPVTLLHSIAGNPKVEGFLHEKFAPVRERGEWFRSTPDLLTYIESLK